MTPMFGAFHPRGSRSGRGWKRCR